MVYFIYYNCNKNLFYIAVPRYGHKNLEINTADVVPVETKSDDTDETLIELVFERPALWNHKLPLQDRTNLKKDALWLEVSNRMGGGDLVIVFYASQIYIKHTDIHPVCSNYL